MSLISDLYADIAQQGSMICSLCALMRPTGEINTGYLCNSGRRTTSPTSLPSAGFNTRMTIVHLRDTTLGTTPSSPPARAGRGPDFQSVIDSRVSLAWLPSTTDPSFGGNFQSRIFLRSLLQGDTRERLCARISFLRPPVSLD